MIEVRAVAAVRRAGSQMRQAGRHRPSMPPEPAGGSSPGVEDVEARLLGQRPSMSRRDLSALASVSLLSARRFWHALGFTDVGDEDVVFTQADVGALQSVAAMVRGGVVDEPTALALTRAFARSTDRLAVWQTRLVADAIGGGKSDSQPHEGSLRAGAGATLQPGVRRVPDPATARAAAMKLADIADDLEPLLIYAWRRHLSAEIVRLVPDSGPDRPGPDMMGDDDQGDLGPMNELSTPTRPMVTITRHGPGDHIAELSLDRPEAMNAVSTQMARDLGAACAELSADPNVRVVLVTSTSPKAFCVGADLKERNSFTDADLLAQRPVARAAYGGVLNLPMPTIAVVEGYALGGGLEIALSCDLIIAGSTAVVGLPEVSVGVIPAGGGTQLLTRRVGWSRAAGMIFTARRMSATEAAALGVVDEVLEPGTARDRGLELAAQIAANSPVGLRQAKRAMRLGADVDLASGLEVEDGCWRATAFSADRAEGVAAFVEKRSARWPVAEADNGPTMRS